MRTLGPTTTRLMATRLPLRHLRVAGSFFATFCLLLLLLLLWYDFPSLSQDPGVLFAWFGTAYVLAHSVAEIIRQRTFFSVLALLCALTILTVDVARHGNLLVQNGVLQRQYWLQLSSTHCAVTGSDGWLCQATTFLVLQTRLVILCAVGGMLLALTGNSVRFIRNKTGRATAKATKNAS
jgi:hypothetical protein